MKVYIVTTGSYNDYKIAAVFDNKKAADKYAETANRFDHYDDYRVEKYEMNNMVPPHRVKYYATVDIEGNEINKWTTLEWDVTQEGTDAEPEVLDYRWLTYRQGSSIEVLAKSYRGFDVALKAARDKLAQWKAEQSGI